MIVVQTLFSICSEREQTFVFYVRHKTKKDPNNNLSKCTKGSSSLLFGNNSHFIVKIFKSISTKIQKIKTSKRWNVLPSYFDPSCCSKSFLLIPKNRICKKNSTRKKISTNFESTTTSSRNGFRCKFLPTSHLLSEKNKRKRKSSNRSFDLLVKSAESIRCRRSVTVANDELKIVPRRHKRSKIRCLSKRQKDEFSFSSRFYLEFFSWRIDFFIVCCEGFELNSFQYSILNVLHGE